MHPHFPLSILLLPTLLPPSTQATSTPNTPQITISSDPQAWNLTGYTLENCGGQSTDHNGTDDKGCAILNQGVDSRSYRFDGIDAFKVCLWGDADCSKMFYRGGTTGDKDRTCHNVLGGLSSGSFSVINTTKICVTSTTSVEDADEGSLWGCHKLPAVV